jgi:hypothetical protein
MAEPRLKAGLWVKMALRMADLDGRAGVVLRKGDADWRCCAVAMGSW